MAAFVLYAIPSPLYRLRSAGGVQISIQISFDVYDLTANLMKGYFYLACVCPVRQRLGIYTKVIGSFTTSELFERIDFN